MQAYMPLQTYVDRVRSSLQDLIPPYRYSDQDIFDALNFVLFETQRIRPDIFLNFKYERAFDGNMDDFSPPIYLTTMNYNRAVPIPSKYFSPMIWYISGYLQTYDVTDTQDQRAQAFMQKFQQHLMTVNAA